MTTGTPAGLKCGITGQALVDFETQGMEQISDIFRDDVHVILYFKEDGLDTQ